MNAGHVGGLITRSSTETFPLETTAPLISPALPPVCWTIEKVEWTSASLILLYTDGIPETLRERELFEEERIHAIVQHIPAGRTELLYAILSEVEQFSGGRTATDDRTLLTARYTGR